MLRILLLLTVLAFAGCCPSQPTGTSAAPPALYPVKWTEAEHPRLWGTTYILEFELDGYTYKVLRTTAPDAVSTVLLSKTEVAK